MKFYPALLNLHNKRCVIIGGGKVAQRKVSSLLNTGAHVLVVSKSLTSGLKRFLKKGSISYLNSTYKKKFLNSVFLVIAATNDGRINSRVYADAQDKGILVNCVDSLKESNFIIPAVHVKGDFIFSISTSGKVPGFAKEIRKDLKNIFNEEYILRLKIIEKVRARLKDRYSPSKRREIIQKLAALPLKQLRNDPLVKTISR